MKAGAGASLGTPFSYSAPGQANELVLIEWGDNPLELLIDDKVREGNNELELWATVNTSTISLLDYNKPHACSLCILKMLL